MAKQESVISAFLLLRTKDARKRPSRKIVPVCKGELIEEFSQPIPADQHSSEHNFHVLYDPSITLWCDPTDVAPLADSECHYLLAVNPQHRVKEFHNRDKKEYVMNLIIGNEVSFRINEGRLVKGRIRYLGPVEGKIGVYFGVEIDQDDEYRGKGTTSGHPHFRCGRKNGVWVSMYMVVYPPPTTTTTTTVRHSPRINRATSKPSSDSGQDTTHDNKTAHKPLSVTDHYAHVSRGDINQGDKAKKMAQRAWNYLTGNTVEVMEQQHSEIFKEGDYVVAYSLKDQRPITAIVRWTGMVRLSQESQVPKAMFVGLETDAEIDPDEEFPGTHIVLNGPKWGDFRAHAGHTKLYLPESVLIKATDHVQELHGKLRQSKQIAENLNMTESQVVDGGLSDVDIKEQEKMLAEVKAQHDAQKQKRRFYQAEEEALVTGAEKQVADFTVSSVTASMVEAQKAEWDRLKKENNKKKTGTEKKPHNDAIKGQITATGLTSGAGLPHKGSTLPEAQPVPPVTLQAEPACDPCPHDYHRHSATVHPYRTTAERQQLAVDQVPDWLTTDNVAVGVKIPGIHEPVTGMVRFVGVVQVKGVNELIAGVQLDEPMVSCTDGTYEGKRLFYCTAGTGYFCPISDLLELQPMYPDTPPATPATSHASPIPATRAPPVAGGTGCNNPLSKYACYEDNDQPGGPALFSQYIGEPRGIQGHHNSCYLDSTVFGLFALSDAFDTMFLDADSQLLTLSSDQEEKYSLKAKNILWKGIINPLRKNGVARFESVMELRNCLEHLGTTLGANKDENDPEEFLNMLFKKVLHVHPFISIRRPFGVEEEYFVQLFFEIDPEKHVLPFTEVLLWKMFKERNISFAEIPSKLLLQMPRFGKDFKMYNRIQLFPSLSLDVAPILVPTSSHNILPLNFPLKCRLQLLSVICIETSHYVCFTCCNDRWLFHDSMADRIADMYNIPHVTEVTQELNEWVYSGNVERLMNSKSWEIPECVRRFTQDAYMCVYVNSESDMHGDPHHTFPLAGIEQVSDEVAILRQEKKSLETTLNEKKTALSQAQQSVSQLQSQLEAVSAEKQTTITLLQQQTQENTHLQIEIAYLKRENIDQKLEVARLQEDNDQKQKQVTTLQSRLAQQPKVVPDSDINFWLVSRDEVHSTGEVLGEGAWGRVTVGMFRGQKVAIKEIHSTIRSEHNDELVYREICLMAKVRHPNLLLFIAAVQNTPSRIDPIFITELLNTDLRNAYQDKRLTNNRIRICILRDVAAALNYLHLQREPIIHRDVSSANVLLQALPDNWWRGKLSDFGSANLVRDATTAAPGAAVYCAPEAFVEGRQSPKIDVYSYGKLFCEVFTSQFPYTKAFPSMLQSMARSWPLMHKIIIRCVEHDPVNRPTMSSIVDQLNVFTQ